MRSMDKYTERLVGTVLAELKLAHLESGHGGCVPSTCYRYILVVLALAFGRFGGRKRPFGCNIRRRRMFGEP
jgi:hypothetical protein